MQMCAGIMQLCGWMAGYGTVGVLWILLTTGKQTPNFDDMIPGSNFQTGVDYRTSSYASCDGVEEHHDDFVWNRLIRFWTPHIGKSLVRRVMYYGKPAVLKSTFSPNDRSTFHTISSVISGTNIQPFAYLTDWMLANYAPFLPAEYFKQFHHLSFTELETQFQLIQQTEFVYLSLNKIKNYSQNHLPDLLETCGTGYIVEFVPEVLDDQFIRLRSWREMLPVIHSFLNLTEELFDADFQLCDVQMSNFGWDPISRKIKILDLDVAFFGPLLSDQFSRRFCSNGEKCDLFDCRANCNLTTGICGPQSADHNLARICRDIFRPGFMQLGLFSVFPLQFRTRLIKLADKCGRHSPDEFGEILTEIRATLDEISSAAID